MATDPHALTYLALGDSYTIGEGIASADRWPVRLTLALRGEGIPLEFPRTLATTGWTTDELSTAMDLATPPLGRYDFVSLLIGVNNQYRGRSAVDYRGEFHELLRRAIRLAGDAPSRVLVLSIPDWGVTPFATQQGREAATVAAEIDEYNAVAAELCNEHGAAFVDITGISREQGADGSMRVDDGLHPSAAMYALWVERALPVARRLLAG
ncbi:SGNH/GDSL hydrolase family protein [Lysobacter sp. GX 14042]|uniref:SGNH/GDSL hydrolase family protein n=1 Tax=Lysobacter sp. GX 14042 TaxID=2907155 RepID=UPI001F44F8DB|nr:SGNH/GDSL hydrolase family protein [Lysobacter sp. GX 14042]MCE7033004.1 SGNH/GDSL hydrolase family protein [Lysobacter sp. GX 14042]